MPKKSCIMQIWAEPGKIGPAHSQLFTNLISVFNVYTKLETVSRHRSDRLCPVFTLLSSPLKPRIVCDADTGQSPLCAAIFSARGSGRCGRFADQLFLPSRFHRFCFRSTVSDFTRCQRTSSIEIKMHITKAEISMCTWRS